MFSEKIVEIERVPLITKFTDAPMKKEELETVKVEIGKPKDLVFQKPTSSMVIPELEPKKEEPSSEKKEEKKKSGKEFWERTANGIDGSAPHSCREFVNLFPKKV